MDVGEKLTELIYATGMVDTKSRCAIIAEELIANGVTLVSKEETQQTDLRGKCGSCSYAVPEPDVHGRLKCFVRCTNPEHIAKYCSRRDVSLRERTVRACKMYKPKEVVENEVPCK